MSGVSESSSWQHPLSGNVTSSESEKKLSEGVSQTKTRILFEGLDYLEMECATIIIVNMPVSDSHGEGVW